MDDIKYIMADEEIRKALRAIVCLTALYVFAFLNGMNFQCVKSRAAARGER